MTSEDKIAYYFLRISAERFGSDLRNFQKEICNLSDEEKGTRLLLILIIFFFNLLSKKLINHKPKTKMPR